MRSIKLERSDDGWSMSTTASVDGNTALLQNVAVNIATTIGSDALHEKRGTQLATLMARGAIYSTATARHAANFAALHTQKFMIATAVSPAQKALTKIKMKVDDIYGQSVDTTITVIGATEETLETTLK